MWLVPALLLAPSVVISLTSRGSQEPLVPDKHYREKQRQVIFNFADLQYFGEVIVGGQRITGIIDTGSFDLVVFDKSCSACGKAGSYAKADSPTFQAGAISQSLYYGSGSVDVTEGFDRVAIGPFGEVNLTFWLGTDAYMPVLENAAFQSIIGVGPPETPASDAWAEVDTLASAIKAQLELGSQFPGEESYNQVKESVELAAEVAVRPTLVKADRVSEFSVCLGRKPGSPGFFIWNDTSYLEMPDAFIRLKVMGRHTWTMNMTNMRLEGGHMVAHPIGCENGCGAIIDSGTSLLMMPYSAAEALKEALMGVSCSNIGSLPDLSFSLDGHQFSLPPDAYVAEMTEEVPESMLGFAKLRRLLVGGGECELAVMETGSLTNYGPLWILGMPFFRSYYTSFHIGSSLSDRFLYVARAEEDCTPMTQASAALSKDRFKKQQMEMRIVNRSRMFIPKIARTAMTKAYLTL